MTLEEWTEVILDRCDLVMRREGTGKKRVNMTFENYGSEFLFEADDHITGCMWYLAREIANLAKRDADESERAIASADCHSTSIAGFNIFHWKPWEEEPCNQENSEMKKLRHPLGRFHDKEGHFDWIFTPLLGDPSLPWALFPSVSHLSSLGANFSGRYGRGQRGTLASVRSRWCSAHFH